MLLLDKSSGLTKVRFKYPVVYFSSHDVFRIFFSIGNAAVVKPSEVSSHTAKVMELLHMYLDPVKPFTVLLLQYLHVNNITTSVLQGV